MQEYFEEMTNEEIEMMDLFYGRKRNSSDDYSGNELEYTPFKAEDEIPPFPNEFNPDEFNGYDEVLKEAAKYRDIILCKNNKGRGKFSDKERGLDVIHKYKQGLERLESISRVCLARNLEKVELDTLCEYIRLNRKAIKVQDFLDDPNFDKLYTEVNYRIQNIAKMMYYLSTDSTCW